MTKRLTHFINFPSLAGFVKMKDIIVLLLRLLVLNSNVKALIGKHLLVKHKCKVSIANHVRTLETELTRQRAVDHRLMETKTNRALPNPLYHCE